jgi:hypothetical protein
VSEDQRRSKAWPKAAHTLTGRLKRLTAPLKEVGIKFSEDRVGHAGARTKRLEKIPPKERQKRQRRQREEKDLQTEVFDADAPADTYSDADASDGADACADASKNDKCQQKIPANDEIFSHADAADASSQGLKHDENDFSDNGFGGDVERLRAYLAGPPEWFERQAAFILRDYPELPDRVLNNIANSVANECLGDPQRWREALPYVRAKLEEMRNSMGASMPSPDEMQLVAYDAMVEEDRAAGAVDRCHHNVLGGCWLCNRDSGGER